MLGYITAVVIPYQNEYAALLDFISFSLLGIQLLILNVLLLRQMNSLFGKNRFMKEKSFLICTLVFFSISYLMSVGKNVLLYMAYKNTLDTATQRINQWFCHSNFRLSVFNVTLFMITEWLPYIIIFALNLRNFRQIDLQERSIRESTRNSTRNQSTQGKNTRAITTASTKENSEDNDDLLTEVVKFQKDRRASDFTCVISGRLTVPPVDSGAKTLQVQAKSADNKRFDSAGPDMRL